MNKFLSFALISVCVFALTAIGCQKPNPDGRENVSGVITLNGKPFEKGVAAGIRFEPVDAADKTAGGHCQIMEGGKYLLTMQDGVKPGKYIVRISASATYDKKTEALATPETNDMDGYQVVLVPTEFNDDSEIEFEVVQGKKNVFNYDIVTDFAPEKMNNGKNGGKPIVAE